MPLRVSARVEFLTVRAGQAQEQVRRAVAGAAVVNGVKLQRGHPVSVQLVKQPEIRREPLHLPLRPQPTAERDLWRKAHHRAATAASARSAVVPQFRNITTVENQPRGGGLKCLSPCEADSPLNRAMN